MSGGPGGVLDCVSKTYSGFMVPTSGSTFDTGEALNITWYGGKMVQGTNLTVIFDVALVHSNDTIGWEKTLFSRSS